MTTDFNFDLKVCVENRDAIQQAILDIQQGKNYGRIDADTVFAIVDDLSSHLLVSHENLIGACIDVDCSANDQLAKRDNPPSSTQITLHYEADGWHLVNIRRSSIRSRKEQFQYSLSDSARKENYEAFLKKYQ